MGRHASTPPPELLPPELPPEEPPEDPEDAPDDPLDDPPEPPLLDVLPEEPPLPEVPLPLPDEVVDPLPEPPEPPVDVPPLVLLVPHPTATSPRRSATHAVTRRIIVGDLVVPSCCGGSLSQESAKPAVRGT
jgi:hypothetical protein